MIIPNKYALTGITLIKRIRTRKFKSNALYGLNFSKLYIFSYYTVKKTH
jgi:hypothetical protein